MTFDKVAIVGLGNMGKKMVEVFAKRGMEVHGWNRSEGKRKEVESLQLANVTVYADLNACVLSSDLIIMNVLGDEDLATANKLIKSIPETSWKDKVMVQYTSQEPLSINDQEKMMFPMGAIVIGGAMLADPSHIGTDHALFLISANDANVSKMEEVKPVLEKLGSVMAFRGDAGYASLLDIGLIETLFFGLAGHELGFKLIQKYGASEEIQQAYAEIVDKTALVIAAGSLSATSQAFLNGNDWVAQGKVFNAGPQWLRPLRCTWSS